MQRTIKKINISLEKHTIADAVFRGIGQIMLQENRWTGLFFLIGIFIGNWQYGIATLLAATTATLTARILKYDYSEIQAGLYGFSAALVGVVLIFFFDATIITYMLVIVGSIAACIIQHFFITKKIPVYTFPFIIISWGIIFLVRYFNWSEPSIIETELINITPYEYLFVGTNGFGQVIFQAGIFSGIILFIGVLINDHIAALYALVASIVGAYIAKWVGMPISDIYVGLFGFNALLSAIVFSGVQKADSVWVGVAVLFTVSIHIILVNSKLLHAVGGVLTFPFVLGTWLTILTQKIVANIKNQKLKT